jgi:hypothetical protein
MAIGGDMRLSRNQVKQQFGDFNYSLGSRGSIRIDPNWVKENITPVNVYGRRILINKQVAPYFEAALKELQENGFQYLINEKDLGMGGYVPRRTKRLRGGYYNTISRHAWGIAVDLNPSKYPYGTTRQQPKPLLDIMSKYGFNIILRSDPMHFEWVGTDINVYKQQLVERGEDYMPAIISSPELKPGEQWLAQGFYSGTVPEYGTSDVWIIVSTDPQGAKASVEVHQTSEKIGTNIYPLSGDNAGKPHRVTPDCGNVRFKIVNTGKVPALVAIKQEARIRGE